MDFKRGDDQVYFSGMVWYVGSVTILYRVCHLATIFSMLFSLGHKQKPENIKGLFKVAHPRT